MRKGRKPKWLRLSGGRKRLIESGEITMVLYYVKAGGHIHPQDAQKAGNRTRSFRSNDRTMTLDEFRRQCERTLR